jgi:hypothetical protein
MVRGFSHKICEGVLRASERRFLGVPRLTSQIEKLADAAQQQHARSKKDQIKIAALVDLII